MRRCEDEIQTHYWKNPALRRSREQDIAFVEVCCGTNSALREACKVARMPYIGLVKRMETADMFQNQKVKEFEVQ